MASKDDWEQLAAVDALRERLVAAGWDAGRIAEEIQRAFGCSALEAHRLARGWSRPQAVEALLGLYDEDGLRRPGLTAQRLCAWERGSAHPGAEYRDLLCRLYRTRPDRLGFGCDYTPPGTTPPIVPAAAAAPYAGPPERVFLPPAGGLDAHAGGADLSVEEAATERSEFLQALGATGLGVMLHRAGEASRALTRWLSQSDVGPGSLEDLELRTASLFSGWEHEPGERLFPEVFAAREHVRTLLASDRQTLTQRRGLYRIGGGLSALLGSLSYDLGDFGAAQAHCLTAAGLAREVGDGALLSRVRLVQSTAALWAGDYRMSLAYAQEGQRCAAGAAHAQLAARGEARAYARMREHGLAMDALRRGERSMPTGWTDEEERGGWWQFSPPALELYTGITLLWTERPRAAQAHVQSAIDGYEQLPLPLRSPANQAQAQITLATCLVHQGRVEEGLQLVAAAVAVDRGQIESNLSQASDFLAALAPAQQKLSAAREIGERVHVLRRSRPGLPAADSAGLAAETAS